MSIDSLLPVRDPTVFGGQRGAILVFRAIRDRGPMTLLDLNSLVFEDTLPPKSWSRAVGTTIGTVLRLIRLHLIQGDGIPRDHLLASTPIDLYPEILDLQLRPADVLNDVQTLFGVSLSALSSPQSESIRVAPTLGVPRSPPPVQRTEIFVLMPFKRELQPIFTDHIRSVADRLSLSCRRGDDFFSSQSIIAEIWSAVFHSKLCVADCTGRNPNVFYEIGLAHAIGTPCVLISQSTEDIPFDLRHLRTIIYEYTPRGMKQFEQQLQETITTELALSGGA